MQALCDASGLGSEATELEKPIEHKIENSSSPRELFEDGHFVAVLYRTTELIPACIEDPSPANVLELWFYRIQSLLILHLGHLAAQEISSNLGSLESEEFSAILKTPEDVFSAWSLSLLLVPVKTKGINPSSVQHYYKLGFQAREEASKNKHLPIKEKWLDGIKLAGLHALSTLIALRDYMTAIHFLRSHYEVTKDSQYAKLLSLLHIMVGDTLGCQAWVSKTEDLEYKNEMDLLRKFADGDVQTGSKGSCIDGVYELYQGKLLEAVERLEQKEKLPSRDKCFDTRRLSNITLLYGTCFNTPTENATKAENLHINYH